MVNMHIVFAQLCVSIRTRRHVPLVFGRQARTTAHRTSHTSSAYSRSSHLRWRGSIAVTGANLSLSNRRVDIADQVKEILAGIQTKSMFRCAWAALPGAARPRRGVPSLPFPFPSPLSPLCSAFGAKPNFVCFLLGTSRGTRQAPRKACLARVLGPVG